MLCFKDGKSSRLFDAGVITTYLIITDGYTNAIIMRSENQLAKMANNPIVWNLQNLAHDPILE